MPSLHSNTIVSVSSVKAAEGATTPTLLRHLEPYNEPYGDGYKGWEEILEAEMLSGAFKVFCHTIQGSLNNTFKEFKTEQGKPADSLFQSCCEELPLTSEEAKLKIVIMHMITEFNFNCNSASIVGWSGTRFRCKRRSLSGDMVEGQWSVRFKVTRLFEYNERTEETPKRPLVTFDVGSRVVQVLKSELDKAGKRIEDSQMMPGGAGTVENLSVEQSTEAGATRIDAPITRCSVGHPDDSHRTTSSLLLGLVGSGSFMSNYGTMQPKGCGVMRYTQQQKPRSKTDIASDSGNNPSDNRGSLLFKAYNALTGILGLSSCFTNNEDGKGRGEKDARTSLAEESVLIEWWVLDG